MTTYIRYRTTTDRILLFKKSVSNIAKKIYADGLITGFAFSQCVSEKENFIFRITWNSLLIEKTHISNETIKHTLITLLDKEFDDYILEMRNYKTL